MKMSCRSIQTRPVSKRPMMGVQFGPMASDVGTPDENFGATRGRQLWLRRWLLWPRRLRPGASGACALMAPTRHSLPSNQDFLVQVEIPTEGDVYGAAAVHPDQPLYQVTREEDINIANGDSFVPQVPPPACAGPLHTVDVAGMRHR